MSGVNPFNFNWNLGGLTWNAWGEPNEVGLDDASPVTTAPPPPPPPSESTDTVTIGSNFTSALGTYQPPNGWNQTDFADIEAPFWEDEVIQDLNLQDPMFWLDIGDMFPEGRHRDLTEEQATAIDYQTYTTSLAKDLGVSWPKYQSEIESARQEFQNSNVQANHQGGSYFFSLDASARVTSHNANPIIEFNENRQAANNLNQQLNDLRKSSKEDFFKLVQQLEANGYQVQGHKIGSAYDRNPNDSITEVYQRVYYTLNGRILPGINNANGAYPLGGMDGFQLVGRAGGITAARGSDISGRRSDLTLPIYISGGGEGYLPGDWVGRNVMDYLENEPGAQYWHMETVAVRDAIKARHDAKLPVILIGHSWGGSEAISNALWAKGKGIRVDLLITVDPVGVPDYITELALAPYAERLRGIATTWVNVTADKPGVGPGDGAAAFWRKTPQVIQDKATRTVSARNADHADFDKMMFAIGAKGLIEGVRK